MFSCARLIPVPKCAAAIEDKVACQESHIGQLSEAICMGRYTQTERAEVRVPFWFGFFAGLETARTGYQENALRKSPPMGLGLVWDSGVPFPATKNATRPLSHDE